MLALRFLRLGASVEVSHALRRQAESRMVVMNRMFISLFDYSVDEGYLSDCYIVFDSRYIQIKMRAEVMLNLFLSLHVSLLIGREQTAGSPYILSA